jgi:hypothetical protein
LTTGLADAAAHVVDEAVGCADAICSELAIRGQGVDGAVSLQNY